MSQRGVVTTSVAAAAELLRRRCKAHWVPLEKKRKVAHECRKISEEIDGVLVKYHESLGCILGNSLLYGGDEQKGKV